MQLLEQLAYRHTSNCSLEFISMECASIHGYIECMVELCESEVLLEGISIKDLAKKVGNFILGIIKKIKDLTLIAIDVLKAIVKKLVSYVKPNKDKDNHRSKKDMTEDELIKDLLNHNPYTGITPHEIMFGVKDVSIFIRHVIGERVPNKIKDYQEILSDIISGKYGLNDVYDDDLGYGTSNKQLLDELFDDTHDFKWFFGSYYKEFNAGTNISGILNGPNNIPKVIDLLYTNGSKKTFDEQVYDEKGINQLQIDVDDTAKKFKLAISNIIKSMENNVKACDDFKSKIEYAMKNLSSQKDADDQFVQKCLVKLTEHWSILSNVSTSIISLIPSFVTRVENDIDSVQQYINGIDMKIKEIKGGQKL